MGSWKLALASNLGCFGKVSDSVEEAEVSKGGKINENGCNFHKRAIFSEQNN